MARKKRVFICAHPDDRCKYVITLSDKSKADCGRRHVDGTLCRQHAKIVAAWACEYCGGNDELPPDHCMDCTRPTTPSAESGNG